MLDIIGKKIVDVIKLPNAISGKEGWEYTPYDGIALVLNDGSFLYPSRDEEGNGPGALFGMNKELDTAYYILPGTDVESN
jgi:hypothetical protein